MRKYTNEYANERTHSTYMNVSLNNFMLSWKTKFCTCIKICHILSSENLVPFSFKELKCSPRGAPSTNSIMTKSLSSVISIKQEEMVSTVKR